jgi:hypothetical protein
MGASTHHHSKGFKSMLVCFAALLCCTARLSAQVSSSSPERTVQESGDWQRYKAEAEQNLRKASQCIQFSSAERSCGDLLDAAAADYRSMIATLKDSDQNVEGVVRLADGLRRAGRASEAIDLLRRYEPKGNGDLLHLLGDILYSTGDYRNSAMMYRKWIDVGCTGYLLSPDDHGLWAKPIKGNPCTSLPAELRARLEDLQDVAHGEPSNLPHQNRTAMRITSR